MISLGGFSCTSSPSVSPSSTSTLIASDSPVLMWRSASGAVGLLHRHERRVVPLGDEPLGNQQHAVAPGDDHLGVGRVAGAERRALHLRQHDLDREDGGLLLLPRLEPDLGELALHLRVGQRADLDDDRHPLGEPAHVDLVHRAAEDQVLHRRHAHEDRALLVGREGHHRVADLDRVLQHEPVDRRADDASPPRCRRPSTLPLSCSASRSCASESCTVDSSTRRWASSRSVSEFRFCFLSSVCRSSSFCRFLSSICRISMLRRSSISSSGVGLGEISSSGGALLHVVAHLGVPLAHHAGEDRLDPHLDPRLDRPDRHRLVGEFAPRHGDRLGALVLRGPELLLRSPAPRRRGGE